MLLSTELAKQMFISLVISLHQMNCISDCNWVESFFFTYSKTSLYQSAHIHNEPQLWIVYLLPCKKVHTVISSSLFIIGREFEKIFGGIQSVLTNHWFVEFMCVDLHSIVIYFIIRWDILLYYFCSQCL